MRGEAALVALLARALVRLLCRMDGRETRREFAKVPAKGPLIIAMNHVNFLDAPLLVAWLQPRRLASLAKRETWDNPFLGRLADLFGGVPVERGAPDAAAMRASLAALAAGRILLIAPEGTRSGTGRLGGGRQGIASLAFHSGAAILPVVVWGHEGILGKLRSLRRPAVHVRVGEAFRLGPPAPGEARRARAEAAAEVMRRLAELLPPRYRGSHGEAGTD